MLLEVKNELKYFGEYNENVHKCQHLLSIYYMGQALSQESYMYYCNESKLKLRGEKIHLASTETILDWLSQVKFIPLQSHSIKHCIIINIYGAPPM